jgi:hypothetical protein
MLRRRTTSCPAPKPAEEIITLLVRCYLILEPLVVQVALADVFLEDEDSLAALAALAQL